MDRPSLDRVGSGQLRAPIHLVERAVAELREIIRRDPNRPRSNETTDVHLGARSPRVLLTGCCPPSSPGAPWVVRERTGGTRAPVVDYYVRVAWARAQARLSAEEGATATSIRP